MADSKPTADAEARGLKAYEQARAFERLRTWRLQAWFTFCALVPALSGAVMLSLGHPLLAGLNLAVAIALAALGWSQWKNLKARYKRNIMLLAQMETEYGDALPWVQVEKHFAELEKLKREMAGEQSERPII